MDRSEGSTHLGTAIRRLLQDVVASGGIPTHLDDRLTEEPTAEARAVIGRIVNEALINVQRHARARSVVVEVAWDDGGVLVTIEDNGEGFDPVKAFELPDDRLGLRVMRERAMTSGGWLRANSALGQGTTITFWIPSSS